MSIAHAKQAKKSMDKFFIGILARLFNSIPVQRPQDMIKKANGQIHMSKDDPLLIHGLDSTIDHSL